MLVGVDVDKPPGLVNGDDTTNDNIADVWAIVTSHRFDTNDLVYVMDYSSHRCVDILGVRLNEGAMACDKALTKKVSGHDNF